MNRLEDIVNRFEEIKVVVQDIMSKKVSGFSIYESNVKDILQHLDLFFQRYATKPVSQTDLKSFVVPREYIKDFEEMCRSTFGFNNLETIELLEALRKNNFLRE